MARKRSKALERLENRRQLAEHRLSDLRRSIDRQLGSLAPRGAFWVVPMVAFACGLALAMTRRKPKRDSSEKD